MVCFCSFAVTEVCTKRWSLFSAVDVSFLRFDRDWSNFSKDTEFKLSQWPAAPLRSITTSDQQCEPVLKWSRCSLHVLSQPRSPECWVCNVTCTKCHNKDRWTARLAFHWSNACCVSTEAVMSKSFPLSCSRLKCIRNVYLACNREHT